MALAKLKIKPMEGSALFPQGLLVQFNPTTYSVAKTVTWNQQSAHPEAKGVKEGYTNRDLNAPPLTFGGGGARTLTLQLFFDVTEAGSNSDVRNETNNIVKLTLIERKTGNPPVVELSWGDAKPPTGSDFPFVGVITSLTQNFTLFRSSGEPLRAFLNLTVLEKIDPEADKKKTDPDDTTYQVKLGDTISTISAALYRDPALWRLIADANRIDDPRQLVVGARLAIPKLR